MAEGAGVVHRYPLAFNAKVEVDHALVDHKVLGVLFFFLPIHAL
jgi:hypothetical protein